MIYLDSLTSWSAWSTHIPRPRSRSPQPALLLTPAPNRIESGPPHSDDVTCYWVWCNISWKLPTSTVIGFVCFLLWEVNNSTSTVLCSHRVNGTQERSLAVPPSASVELALSPRPSGEKTNPSHPVHLPSDPRRAAAAPSRGLSPPRAPLYHCATGAGEGTPLEHRDSVTRILFLKVRQTEQRLSSLLCSSFCSLCTYMSW